MIGTGDSLSTPLDVLDDCANTSILIGPSKMSTHCGCDSTVLELGEGGALAVRELVRDNEYECRRVWAVRLGVAWSRVERSMLGMGEWLH
jgi:hypothetical protein